MAGQGGLARVPAPRRISRNDDERAFLPAALEIVETPASPAGRAIGGVIVAAIVFALLWSVFGKVDINATATGRVVPIGKIKTIQPLESGIVRAIDVNDGDHVTAGDILVELEETPAKADQERYTRDLLQARLDQARLEGLKASLDGKPPELVDPPANASDIQLRTARAAMLSQASEQSAKLASLDEQITSKDAETAEAVAAVGRLQASMPLVQQQEDIRRKLKEMEFGNKLAYLEAEQRRVEQEQQIIVFQRQEEQSRASKLALKRQRDQAVSEYEKTILADLSKSIEQVSGLNSELTKASQRLKEQTLTAPIDGTVQQLAIHTVGGVVTPAQALMVIVPEHGGLEVEATVPNRDVGFVHPGQTAEVKIETFTFTRYGMIDGVVHDLSRDIVFDPNGSKTPHPSDSSGENDPEATKEPGYIARIALSRNWIETETGRQSLGPGMTVTVEIHTGRRRIISYLLSPLVRRVDESLHER